MSVRIPDLPVLSAPTDDTLIVADHVGTGVITASALRDYITVSAGGPYLSLSGGTLTGTLSTSATSDIESGRDIYASNAMLIGDHAGGFPWLCYIDGSGNRVENYGAGGVDTFIASTGGRHWDGTSGNLMYLTSAGVLGVSTEITAPTIQATGNMFVNGTITAGAINAPSAPLSTGPITTTTVNASGVVTGAGFNTSGAVNATQLSLGGGFRIAAPSPNREIFWSAAWRLSWEGGGGNLSYVRDGDNAALMTSFGADGNFFILGPTAYKSGGGSWTSPSDARIKTVIGDYTRGLADILALQPKRYTYKGNDTPDEPQGQVPYSNSPNLTAATAGTEFAGLVAQDIQSIWPEMVSSRAGYIDGTAESDILSVDRSDLNLALVNAVRELEARIAALEAAAARSQTMHHE